MNARLMQGIFDDADCRLTEAVTSAEILHGFTRNWSRLFSPINLVFMGCPPF